MAFLKAYMTGLDDLHTVYLNIFMQIISQKTQQQVFWLVVFSVKCVKYCPVLHCTCATLDRDENEVRCLTPYLLLLSALEKNDVSNQEWDVVIC